MRLLRLRIGRDMDDAQQHVVNRLLHELRTGNREAFSQLLPVVYDELHRIAGRQRHQWEGDETFNTTALVHEAYLKLVDQSAQKWESYPHFLAVASTAMRQVLLDYAKRKHAVKRGGNYKRVPIEDIDAALSGSSMDNDARSAALIALDDSLRRLEQRNQRQSRIVECRFFGEMTIQDTATALGIAPATVSRGWEMAKAWLYRDLKETLESST
ncbi:MAG TPA: ECF-type sigma factor [Gemmatimonadaceae bacterium]|jgi:RNA polymerase sigma factor (TIGR02999 family)|nr:ECF-type sigma factor [Gemmatimonadaceae bacterium]